MTDTVTAAAEGARPLGVIAKEIFADWKTMRERGDNHPAYPFAAAMLQLETIEDVYYAERGKEIVLGFIGNAQGWRGVVAQRVKAELRKLVNLK